MGKYEEAKDIASTFKSTFNHYHWNELIQMPLTLLTHFKVWYDERRDSEACETCNNFSTIACPMVGFEKTMLLCRRYRRRIVEKEDV